MLSKSVFLYKKGFQILRTVASVSPEAAEKWDIFAAVCLERFPIITPSLNNIEKQFKTVLSEIEYEKSYKNDWEVRDEQEKKTKQQLSKGEDVDVVVTQTVQDFIDASAEERLQFKEADRITEADKLNDLSSLNRKLDKHLVLVVEQKFNDKSQFILPQGKRKDGETLRQTAERIFKEICGNNIKAQFLGNAPAGFHKFKYSTKNDSVGVKVFIYSAYYKEGQIIQKGTNFKWLDRKELQKELPPKYHKNVSAFLIDQQ